MLIDNGEMLDGDGKPLKGEEEALKGEHEVLTLTLLWVTISKFLKKKKKSICFSTYVFGVFCA